jgi:parallel beta-helix repeat protein
MMKPMGDRNQRMVIRLLTQVSPRLTGATDRQVLAIARWCSVSLIVGSTLAMGAEVPQVQALSENSFISSDTAISSPGPIRVVQHLARPAETMVMFVNPATGVDATGDGSQRSPFRTLTHALQVARPGTTIMLSAGTYSTETGETFPIQMTSGVTVYGSPSTQGEGILIRGGGDFISPTATRQNIAILGANDAILTGVTVTNPNHRGYGIWVESTSLTIKDSTLTGNRHDGVSVNGTGAPVIQGNHFYGNGANGVSSFGRSRPHIESNHFEQTGYAINAGDRATPTVINNQILNNRSGVVVQEQAHVTLRQNTIAHNQQHGVVAIAQAQVDMGTVDSPGNNELANNGQFDINANVADYPVLAVGNAMNSTQVTGSVDFHAQSSPFQVTAASSPVLPTESTESTVPLPVNLETLAMNSAPPPEQPVAVRILRPASPPSTVDRSSSAQSSFGQDSRIELDTQNITVTQAQPVNVPLTVSPSSPLSNAGEPQPLVRLAGHSGSSSTSPPSTPRLIRPQTPSLPNDNEAIPIRVIFPENDAVAHQQTAPVAASPTVPQNSSGVVWRIRQTYQAGTPQPSAPAQTSPSQPRRLINPAAFQVSSAVSNETLPPNGNLLRVPTADVPYGHVGNATRVALDTSSPYTTAALHEATRQRLPLQYRVVVDPAQSPGSLVQSLVPGAFYTRLNGRSLLQVGAFAAAENASALAQQLAALGIQSEIYTIER